MEKYYYNTQDVMKITGYKKGKARQIINELNLQLKEQYEKENKPIYIIDRGVPIWFFKKIMGIERSD